MRRYRLQGLVLILALASLLLLGLAPHAHGDGDKEYHWDYIAVDITVLPDGDLDIVETQRYVFTEGTFTFAYRDLALQRVESIDDIWIEEGGQRYGPDRIRVEQRGNALRVTWYYPPTQNASRTFALHYRVSGALRVYEGGDQLWWKAIFADRDFPVRRGRVTVHLPAAFTQGQLKVATYGVPAEYDIVDAQTVEFATGTVPAGQELEVRIQFPHGVVQATRPSWQDAFDRQRAYDENVRPAVTLATVVLSLLVLIGGVLGVFLLWYLRGRERPVGLVAEYLTEPPADLPPGLAGVLLDEKADMRDIVATLVDLARRGIIQIHEQAEGGLFGIGAHRDFTFRLLQPEASLRPFEAEIVQGVFGASLERRLSDLRNRFHRALPRIKRRMYEEVVAAGLFPRSPESVRWQYGCLGGGIIATGVLAATVGVALLSQFTSAPFCPFGAVMAVGAALLAASAAMPRRTQHGAEQAARWRAFRRYLEHIEKYADLSAAKNIFDRYLPYAVAFGLDREWVRKFAEIDAPAPGWYVPYPPVIVTGGRPRGAPASGAPDLGGGLSVPSLQGMSDGMARSLQSMSDGLSSMLNSAGTILSSAPSSRGGGGGWSGGGGRGGGGGGGGGGGAG